MSKYHISSRSERGLGYSSSVGLLAPITKLFPSLCLLVLLLLQYKLWFMQDGIIASWQLKSAIAQEEQDNTRLLARNNRLASEINAWKTGSTIIEAHARYELGMVKNGEVFYRILQ